MIKENPEPAEGYTGRACFEVAERIEKTISA